MLEKKNVHPIRSDEFFKIRSDEFFKHVSLMSGYKDRHGNKTGAENLLRIANALQEFIATLFAAHTVFCTVN